VKLPALRIGQLLSSTTAIPFTVGRRAMRAWAAVALPDPHAEPTWRELATEARIFVDPSGSSVR
ncbi:MAG TPA: hypothetical protein VNE21_06375, partial [Mycobacteriales bacterium]|nr:hypothetical protein [Mycobacteriales bacterium]